jgi:hypothetical protein
MAGNITTRIDHKTIAEQAHEARLQRADQDLALEKAKLHLDMQIVDQCRAAREKAKTEIPHASDAA